VAPAVFSLISAGLVLAPALNKRRVNEIFETNKRLGGYSRNYGSWAEITGADFTGGPRLRSDFTDLGRIYLGRNCDGPKLLVTVQLIKLKEYLPAM
jgi:hypothetical protein